MFKTMLIVPFDRNRDDYGFSFLSSESFLKPILAYFLHEFVHCLHMNMQYVHNIMFTRTNKYYNK